MLSLNRELVCFEENLSSNPDTTRRLCHEKRRTSACQVFDRANSRLCYGNMDIPIAYVASREPSSIWHIICTSVSKVVQIEEKTVEAHQT